MLVSTDPERYALVCEALATSHLIQSRQILGYSVVTVATGQSILTSLSSVGNQVVWEDFGHQYMLEVIEDSVDAIKNVAF